MKRVQSHIARKQQEFCSHAFFGLLVEGSLSEEHILVFAKELSFWVMSFQDILRINESLVIDPILKRIARHHRAEDAGHEKWFLSDLMAIEGAIPDFRWLFSDDHASTRIGSYALVSEVYRAKTDYERIVLLLTLESAGHAFFEKIISYLERRELSGSLQYFARKHLDVEKQHELFEEQLTKTLFDTVLDQPTRETCVDIVDRIYSVFDSIFVGIDLAIETDSIRNSNSSKRMGNLRNVDVAC
jgi:hypothetical protein